MVDWAGLEIRRLSQVRGFESLSLLETKRNPLWVPFPISTFSVKSNSYGSNRLQVYKRGCASGLFLKIVRHEPQMKFTGPEVHYGTEY